MGKDSGEAPPAPDPQQTAQAQAAANADTARLTARLNRINEYTPLGSRTFTDLGNDQYQSNVTLSPNQQGILGQQERATSGLFGLANDQIPRVGTALGTNLNFSGLPDPISQGNDIAGSADRVAGDIYSRGMARLAPDFAQQKEDTSQDLANRGIPIGSEAYGNVINRMDRSQNDARQNLALGAEQYRGTEQSRLSNLAMGLRQQGIQEQSLIRSQPLNDVAQLLGTGGGPQLPQFNAPAPVNVSPTDVIGPINTAYQTQLLNWQNQQKQNQGMMGGMFGLAGNAAAAGIGLISDRRAKRDIRKVGKLRNGLPVYLFRYKAGGPFQIGLMAQDVEKVHPKAVATIEGVKAVNYEAAVA